MWLLDFLFDVCESQDVFNAATWPFSVRAASGRSNGEEWWVVYGVWMLGGTSNLWETEKQSIRQPVLISWFQFGSFFWDGISFGLGIWKSTLSFWGLRRRVLEWVNKTPNHNTFVSWDNHHSVDRNGWTGVWAKQRAIDKCWQHPLV